jgi:hypothetical protein
MGLNECSIIDLPKIADPRGNSFIKPQASRILSGSYLYDVPGGAMRRTRVEETPFIIAVTGSFDVLLMTARNANAISSTDRTTVVRLPMVWRELDNFSSGAVSLVLASEPYGEADYTASTTFSKRTACG